MDEQQIAQAALDEPDADRRSALLNRLCGDDQELRNRVEALLRPRPSLWGRVTIEAAPATPTGPTDPEIRGRLGPYEIESLLGRGGMGTVYLARDPRLDRRVAVKVLKESLAHDRTAHERFLREARAAAAVSHPNVVTIYSVEDSSSPYLVMEYVAGRPLSRKIDEEGPLDPSEIVRIGGEVAAGLVAAHDRGLIHRDITPGNILLQAPNDTARIADFGLARASNDIQITQTGAVAGTPLYMSPEQARGETLDDRSDLFSLGSVLYTMAAGRPPFQADSAVAVLHRVCDTPHPPLSQAQPGFPDWLSQIIDRLLAKDPTDRFQTATELVAILDRYRRQLVPTAEVRPAIRPKSPPAPLMPVRERSIPPPETKPHRPRFPVWVGLLGMVSAAAYLGWSHLSRGPEPQPDMGEPITEAEPIEIEAVPPPRPDRSPRANGWEWGKFIDPIGGCSTRSDDRGMTWTVPGDVPRDLRPLLRKNLDAARMLTAVTGDFTLEVRIDAFPLPASAGSLESGQPGFQSAGLLVWGDPLHLIRFERLALAADSPKPARIRALWYGGGMLVADHQEDAGEGPIWLQIARTSRRFLLRTSHDGRFWSDFQELEHPGMTAATEVGLAVANTTDQRFSPRFGAWKLTSPASARSSGDGSP